MTQIFDFKEQLALGNEGEALFLEAYPEFSKIENGIKGDFYNAKGEIVELKYEQRSTNETPNIFIEQYKNEEGDLGGPYQAMQYGATYYVVLFSDSVIYWFETEALVAHLEKHKSVYQTRKIYNKGWTALGYLVPRASLEDLIVKKERLFERD